MSNTSSLDQSFHMLQRAAIKCGDREAHMWTLHPGSRARGVPWVIVIPNGKVRSITLSDSRSDAERTIQAMTRLFENYAAVTP